MNIAERLGGGSYEGVALEREGSGGTGAGAQNKIK